MKSDTAVSLDFYVSGDSKLRRHGGRALCPNHQKCEDTYCRCRKPHWRGTLCSRDRRDQCPTCRILSPDIKNTCV